jgi:Zn-dependent M28 family amino/carboxypeptidase
VIRQSKSRRWAIQVLALTSGMALAATALTSPASAKSGTNNTSDKLRKAVSAAGMSEHLTALQAIADANGGNRFAGLPGHDESVDYAVGIFEDAGYETSVQAFDYLASAALGPGTLEQTAPSPVTYVQDVDWGYLQQSDPGEVTAAVTPVDLQLGLGNTNTSGCEAADWAGFPAGNIALVQRGFCTFEQKIENAAAAGATAVVFFNAGDTSTPDRNGIPAVTLGAGNTSGIPGVGATYARGVEWANTFGLRMHVDVNVVRELKTTHNVLAETPGGDADNVVMAGAHLDSVGAGPGINDNGSGSAAILEIAEQMTKVNPTNKVRFALWSAEESGLVGSTYYVDHLAEADRAKIALYLNFDMIDSPNYVRFVYDGDNSAFPVGPNAAAGPPGSGDIEKLFHNYFASVKLASAETAFSGRSDYGRFIFYNIPSGGLFTGAEGTKTAAEAATYGGQAGVAYDPCYHQACDTFSNVNQKGLEEMGDAVAHAVITYAFDTRSVNGTGKGHPVGPPVPVPGPPPVSTS